MNYQLEQTGQQVQDILNQAPTTEENLQSEITRSTNKDNELETAIENEETRAEGAEGLLQTAIENEVSRAEGVEGNLQTAINTEKNRAEGVEGGLRSDVDAIKGKIPTGASDQNKLATEGFVNSSISTNTADFKGTYNSIEELQTEVPTATANDYAFVISTDERGNTVYNRYKYVTGTGWVFEYALNNSSFTAAQWAAINSAITAALVAKLNGLPNAAELTQQLNAIIDSVATEKARAEGIEGGLRTDVNANAAAIVTEKKRAQGVEGTLQTSIVAEENRAKAAETLLQQNINAEALLRDNADDALQDEIDGIDAKIPTQASASNQLADKAFVNSSIATNTGEFKGTYNSLTELQAVTNVNANDYGFVITTDSDGNKVYNRYKYVEGQGWVFEYALNNSSFTAAQWGAINSGITAVLAAKINGLPDIDALNAMFAAITSKIPADASSSNKLVDYAQLVYALSSKQDTLIFDNVPTENSNNPVKSGGIYQSIATVTAAIVGLQSSKQDVLTFDQYPTPGSDNPVRSTGIYSAIDNAVAPKANQTDLDNAVIRISTNEVDIAQLQAAYRGLTQNDVVPVAHTDTWPVANPQLNTIYRVSDREHTPPQNYSDYMYNGTAMVLMATYDNAIDDIPTPGSNNLVKSGGVASHIVYDISEANAVGGTLATYADLEAALGVDGANVPASIRRGGMSIKFVHSFDNKYLQYRYMGTDITGNPNPFLNTANWQGIDYEPTAESPNLVKSGGVFPTFNAVNKALIPITGKVSIIGDSISTFAGTMPSGYGAYYPKQPLGVISLYDMWWHLLLSMTDSELEVNASWSGSRVTNGVYGIPDFYARTNVLGSPDYIFVALGTNDSINSVVLGDYDYDTEDLSESEFIPAYIKGVKALKTNYPNAKIVLFVFEMSDSYASAIKNIGKHYELDVIDVRSYYTDNVHPNKLQMCSVAQTTSSFYIKGKIDDEPTAGSENPVKSGGVFEDEMSLRADVFGNFEIPTEVGIYLSNGGYNAEDTDHKSVKIYLPKDVVCITPYTRIAMYDSDKLFINVAGPSDLKPDYAYYRPTFDATVDSATFHQLPSLENEVDSISTKKINAVWTNVTTDRYESQSFYIKDLERVFYPLEYSNADNAIFVWARQIDGSFVDFGAQSCPLNISEIVDHSSGGTKDINDYDIVKFRINTALLKKEQVRIVSNPDWPTHGELSKMEGASHNVEWTTLTTNRSYTFMPLSEFKRAIVNVGINNTANFLAIRMSNYSIDNINLSDDKGWFNKIDFSKEDLPDYASYKYVYFYIDTDKVSASDVFIYKNIENTQQMPNAILPYDILNFQLGGSGNNRWVSDFIPIELADIIKFTGIIPSKTALLYAIQARDASGQTTDLGWQYTDVCVVSDIVPSGTKEIRIVENNVFSTSDIKFYCNLQTLINYNSVNNNKGLLYNIKNAAVVSDWKHQLMSHCATIAVKDGYAYVAYYGNNDTTGESYTYTTTYLVIEKVSLCDFTDIEVIGTFYAGSGEEPSDICGWSQGARPPYDPNLLIVGNTLYVYIQAFSNNVYSTIILPYNISTGQWGTYIMCTLGGDNFTNTKMQSLYENEDVDGNVVYATFTGKIVYYNNEYWTITGQAVSGESQVGITNMQGFLMKSSDAINWTVVSIPPYNLGNNFESSLDILNGSLYVIFRENVGGNPMHIGKYNISNNTWSALVSIKGSSSKGWIEVYQGKIYAICNLGNTVLEEINQSRGVLVIYEVSADLVVAQKYILKTDDGCNYPTLFNYSGTLYMVFSSDRRHLAPIQGRSDICLMTIGDYLR